MKQETRKELIKKAEEMGVAIELLQNLTSSSIEKIVEYEIRVKEKNDAIREISGYRTKSR